MSHPKSRFPIQLKVCGMRDTKNIQALVQLQPDYIGFIFYPKSPRFVGEELDIALLQNIPSTIQKVGVFVNSEVEEIQQQIKKYGLDMIQLHGQESPAICKAVKAMGVKVMKVFGIGKEDFDFSILSDYEAVVDFFLFDTKSKQHGGTGVTFNWKVLQKYQSKIPFFLSGGISLDNIEGLLQLKHLPVQAVDINSKFEIEPALKDIEQIKQLKNKLETIRT